MAIPKSKRTTTPLSVLAEADTLTCYTIQICTDERRFPKRYRWCLTQQIIDTAEVSLRCWAAHAEHGNNYNVIKKMYEYYRNLWREGVSRVLCKSIQ